MPYGILPKSCTSKSPLIVEAAHNIQGADGQKVVAELLRRGVSVNSGISNHNTPLNAALEANNSQLARFLLMNGANPNDGFPYFANQVLKTADPALLRLLIQKGLPTKGAHQWDNALYWASSVGKVNTVQYLLARGENPKQSLIDGTTPLMGAAENGHYEIVKLLLQKGANPNAKNRYGMTALFFALGSDDQNKNRNVIKLLMGAGGSLFVKTNYNVMPFDFTETAKAFRQAQTK